MRKNLFIIFVFCVGFISAQEKVKYKTNNFGDVFFEVSRKMIYIEGNNNVEKISSEKIINNFDCPQLPIIK